MYMKVRHLSMYIAFCTLFFLQIKYPSRLYPS